MILVRGGESESVQFVSCHRHSVRIFFPPQRSSLCRSRAMGLLLELFLVSSQEYVEFESCLDSQ